jgi:diazepam-binding inhibitor (GABA receptor modulating acyl-CoA-binding protein)
MQNQLEEEFNFAVDQVRNSKKNGSFSNPTDVEKLVFYKYFKQATVGNCTGERPWIIQLEERAKWDAWNSVHGVSKYDAMRKYCDYFLKINDKYVI